MSRDYDIQMEGYKGLAAAIIIRAAEDYYHSRFILETINDRTYKSKEYRRKAIIRNESTLFDVERYFKSDEYEKHNQLVNGINGGVTGTKALANIKNTYEEQMKFNLAEQFYGLDKEDPVLKGYPVSSGYKGWTKNGWMLFETEGAYEEYMKD